MLRAVVAHVLALLLLAAPAAEAQRAGAHQDRFAAAIWSAPGLHVQLAGRSYRDTSGRREDGRLLRVAHERCDEAANELVEREYDALLPVTFDEAALTAASRATAMTEGVERRTPGCVVPDRLATARRPLPPVEVASDLTWVARGGVPPRPGLGLLGCPGVFASTLQGAIVGGGLRGELPVDGGLRLEDLGAPDVAVIGFDVAGGVC